MDSTDLDTARQAIRAAKECETIQRLHITYEKKFDFDYNIGASDCEYCLDGDHDVQCSQYEQKDGGAGDRYYICDPFGSGV